MKAKLSLSLSHIDLPNYLKINLIWQKYLFVGEVAAMDTEGEFAEMYESFTFLVSVTASIV
jgi:spore maturation protein SpmA